MIRTLIPAAVMVVAAVRVVSLGHEVSPPAPIPAITDREVESLQTGALQIGLGITQVQYQRFDPQAAVVVSPGPDQLPGVAGTDDNMNGITDDRLELGATRSDDPCVVLTADQLAAMPQDQVMILQRGAFVTTEDPTASGRRRAIVSGMSDDGGLWSAIVDLVGN